MLLMYSAWPLQPFLKAYWGKGEWKRDGSGTHEHWFVFSNTWLFLSVSAHIYTRVQQTVHVFFSSGPAATVHAMTSSCTIEALCHIKCVYMTGVAHCCTVGPIVTIVFICLFRGSPKWAWWTLLRSVLVFCKRTVACMHSRMCFWSAFISGAFVHYINRNPVYSSLAYEDVVSVWL